MNEQQLTRPERDTALRLALYDVFLDSHEAAIAELPYGQIADRYSPDR